MDESQGAAERSSGLIALRLGKARRSDNRENNLDDEDVIAPKRRVNDSLTKDKHDDENNAGEKVKALAKELADFADGGVREFISTEELTQAAYQADLATWPITQVAFTQVAYAWPI